MNCARLYLDIHVIISEHVAKAFSNIAEFEHWNCQ